MAHNSKNDLIPYFGALYDFSVLGVKIIGAVDVLDKNTLFILNEFI